MLISNFDELLGAARAQDEPQRLLFVFTHASLPDDSSAAQRAAFAVGEGGQLAPVMCVDKTPEELACFDDLKAEAGQMGEDWTLVFVAAMAGLGGRVPTRAEAEAPLQKMVEAIKTGTPLNAIPFNVAGQPVRLG